MPRKSQYTEEQIIRALKENEAGAKGQAAAAATLHLLKTESRESNGLSMSPTLREFIRDTYAKHSKQVHCEAFQRVAESQLRRLIFYLGDLPINAIGPREVSEYLVKLRQDGPQILALKANGTPGTARVKELSNAAINKSLSLLRAILNLAFKHDVIQKQPRIELLPEDDSVAIVPPSDAEIARLLELVRAYVVEAPFIREAIELSIETGLREGELFNLTWGSLEQLGTTGNWGIRVEEQTRTRAVSGKTWKPKNRKTRFVPLSPRALEVMGALWNAVSHDAVDLVIPNVGGSPYIPLHDSKAAGRRNTWRKMKKVLGLRMRWHDFRHLFAVRKLQAGVPIHSVSQWLGHSDINLTVKSYGRFSAENVAQWEQMSRGASVSS